MAQLSRKGKEKLARSPTPEEEEQRARLTGSVDQRAARGHQSLLVNEAHPTDVDAWDFSGSVIMGAIDMFAKFRHHSSSSGVLP
jgi:hypothetical protein